MFFKKLSQFLLICISMATTSVLFADTLINNGSFEEHGTLNRGSWGLFSEIPGWTLESGQFEIQRGKIAGISADDGQDKLELDASSNSVIYTTFPTVSGQKYIVSFSYSPRVQRNRTNTNDVNVFWNDTKISSLSGDKIGWQEKTYIIEANNESTNLKFSASGTSDGLGGFIDDVSVVALSSLGSNLLLNGSFEQYGLLSNGNWGLFESIPSWIASKGSIEVQINNASGLSAVDGTAIVELDSNRNSTIEQELNSLESGEQYRLIFSYSPRVNGHRNTNRIQIKWNNRSISVLNGRSKGWNQYIFDVTARSNNSLEFRAIGKSDGLGGLIDDVQLYCISCANESGPDTDGDGVPDATDTDDDNDSVLDIDDAFPLDGTESVDTDNDGVGNNADIDDDNDSVLDAGDAFPLDATESVDSDSDGTGNNADTDDDNDSVLDADDAFPLDGTESIDTDNDGTGNNADTDDDNDSVLDVDDAFPLDENESVDTDGDGTGNNADTDDDNDSVLDAGDAFPLDGTESVDTDNDGTGNNADTDDDNDSVLDANDAFPLDASESVDTDGDGTGNNADADDDNDSVLDTDDAFPLDASESVDTDGDGTGNNADTDDDNDSVLDADDAFPIDSNESADTDNDGTGNNADTDDDNDSVLDADDAFPLDATESVDTDGDGTGNNADTDDDNDSVLDTDDVFPLDANESVDTDNDGTGNNADTDDDNDSVLDTDDVFPLDVNESVDTDSDGTGNNADTDDDNDLVLDADDAFPLDGTESVDTDNDGTGNNADTDDDNDSVLDTDDAFPLDTNESVDTDNDGTGNNADTDDDNDSVLDADDGFPLDANESVDTDNDGTGNNADTDDDNDSVLDTDDAFPLDGSETIDTDNDGTGNNVDTDDDGDSVLDADDVFPLDPTEAADLDGDNIGDNADTDRDGDGVENSLDDFPEDATQSLISVAININSPSNGFVTTATTTEIVGAYSGNFTAIKVQDVDAVLNQGEFRATIDLREGINKITAVGFYALPTGENRAANATRNVIKDTTPPEIIITSIDEAMVTTESEITVAGSLDDVRSNLSEVAEPSVTVNGITVEVVNRSFELADFLLQPGNNNIRIVATDSMGNSKLEERNVNYLTNAGQRVIEVQGNNQSDLAGVTLPEPLVVKLVDRNNLPITDRPVTFKVKEGNGLVTDLPREGRELTAITNEQGLAEVNFKLGSRHGAGKHQVIASSIGFPAAVIFSATAQTLSPSRISVSRGNYQTGMMDSELPEPIVARVVDANGNPVSGVDVSFNISEGAGRLVGIDGAAATILTLVSDIDGNTAVEWVMGNDLNSIGTNSQIVDVAVIGSEGIVELTTKFTATNLKPGPVNSTSVVGIVLDNSNEAMPDVEVNLSGDHFATLRTLSDSEGRFEFLQAPIGTVHLGFDGGTTSRTGEYPKLMYELVTISGQENTVGMPIYIPTLNVDGGKVAGGDQEVIIPMEGVEGAEVIIAPNSVTLPDGRTEGNIMFSQVQTDKIPMPAPNGSVFDVAWTLQPSGTHFDPPARISLPNANGGLAGEEQEMFSFDHDLMEWISIGPGVVSDDGSRIISREGFGVRSAGWGGTPPPPPPPTCNIKCSNGRGCYAVSQTDCECKRTFLPDKVNDNQQPDDCKTFYCGIAPTAAAETGAVKQANICNKCEGTKVVLDEDQVYPDDQQKPDDCKILFCGKDPDPVDETEALKAKGGDNKCKLCSNGEIEDEPNATGCGDGSTSQSCYTCKDGKCGNQCEITSEPTTIESDVPPWMYAAITGIENIVKGTPIFTANFVQDINVKLTEGKECCESCETPGPQIYQEYSGSVGVKGRLQVTIPGLGIAKEMPTKILKGGYAFKAEIFVTLLGAEVSFDTGAAVVAYKTTDCMDENCGSFSLGTSVSGSFGPQVNGSASFDSCVSADCKDSITYIGAEVTGGGVIKVGGNFQSFVSSKLSCGNTCFGGNLDPTSADAYFSIAIRIAFQKFTYSAKKSFELHPGGPIGNSCN